MTQKSCIDASGWLRMLLCVFLADCLLIPAVDLPAPTVREMLLSVLIRVGWLWLFFLPTYLCKRRHASAGSVAMAVVSLPLCLLFLYRDSMRLYAFFNRTVTADLSPIVLTVLVLVLCLVGAFYGMESITRTAGVVVVIGLAVTILFGVLLLPQMRVDCVSPDHDVTEMGTRLWRELPYASTGVFAAVTYPYVRHSRGKAYVAFVSAAGIVTILSVLATFMVLGDFASMTAFPFYTAVSAIRINGLGRVDLLSIIVWVSTCFVRMALSAVLWCDGACRVFGKRARIPSLVIAGVVAAGLWLPPLSQMVWSSVFIVLVAVYAVSPCWRRSV